MATVSSVLHGILPPYVHRAYWAIVNRLRPPPTVEEELQGESLFDGNDALFTSCVSDADVYGEYGCGKSTVWVSRHADCDMVSVDTSREWIGRVQSMLGSSSRQRRLVHVDLGEIGRWGTPVSYAQRHRIIEYVSAPWSDESRKPDVVLIDGRFRIACFLYSLLHSSPGCVIIIDDYSDRPHYHVVEEFCAVSRRVGRQVMFVTPDSINRSDIEAELSKFMYVRD
ncbi:MAG: hypothetical protein Rubg2KO_31300 [Rubricoccaceae bacterium]